jgi:hypothetical protein
MDGWKLIREGRELGMTTAALYRPYNRLYNEIRRFVDADYFGVTGWDDDLSAWVPMHVNSAANPFPSTDYFGNPCRRTFRKADLVCHLAAEPRDPRPRFAFFVNSPSSPYAMLTLDIDGKDHAKVHDLTCDLYHDLFVADWDYGGHVWIEPSPNLVGRYIRVIVERTSDPLAFNLLCNALSAVLKSRYRKDDENRFDAIKSTLHYDDRDDLERLYAEADGHVNDSNRGVLATMPLSGALRRADPKGEIAAFLAWVARDRRGRYRHAIPESHLRGLLERFDTNAAAELDAGIAALRRSKECQPKARPAAQPPTGGRAVAGNLYPSESPVGAKRPSRSAARNRLIDKAQSTASGKNRMRFACSLFSYEHRRYPDSPSELVDYYKRCGFARGADDPKKDWVRYRRADDAIADHKANPAKVVNGYDPADWLPMVHKYVTDEVRRHRVPATGSRVPRWAASEPQADR